MGLTWRKSPTRWLLYSMLASISLSLVTAYLVGTQPEARSVWMHVLFVFAVLGAFGLPVVALALALFVSFRRDVPPAHRLRTIALSYGCMILVFTGLYFMMALTCDYDDAHDGYLAHQDARVQFERGAFQQFNPVPLESQRAFNGIGPRLWTTIDDRVSYLSHPSPEELEKAKAFATDRYPLKQVVTFNKGAITAVLLDCLHFSVITIATVGYGDITPRIWFSKLAADAEALTGTALLVVALGFAFSAMGGAAQNRS